LGENKQCFTHKEKVLSNNNLHTMSDNTSYNNIENNHSLTSQSQSELSELKNGWSISKTANVLGISKPSVHNALKIAEIVEKKPELAKEKKGTVILKKAKFLDLEEKTKDAPFPNYKYNVIYADPPWQYDNSITNWGPANIHYKTLSTDEICSLKDINGKPIQELFADNAVLFLWVTNPMLEDGFKVAKAWGFEYKTNLVWIKTNLKKPGSGFYVRGRHELLFICTRGSFVPDQTGKEPIGSVIEADVQEHSKKPDIVYEIIEKLYPKTEGSNIRYLELFARNRRENWNAWGNELLELDPSDESI
jgi:N6-adenosine-specific RNA methylase IME4